MTSYKNILIYTFAIVTYCFLYPIVYNLSLAHNVHNGDCENTDKEEYNFGYALWLKEEGWNAEETEVVVRKEKKKTFVQHKQSKAETKLAKLTQVVDLTSKKSIAGQHIYYMDASGKKV